jgi:hypothetical protein
LIADTKPVATVFSARVGLSGAVGPSMGAAVWIGAMYQRIQETVAGNVDSTTLQFVVIQSPEKPWNTLIGAQIGSAKDWYVLVEGGLGARMSILAAAVYRFDRKLLAGKSVIPSARMLAGCGWRSSRLAPAGTEAMSRTFAARSSG